MQVRYSAKRPSQVALLSAKNKNLRLQFAPKLGNKRFKIFCLMLKSWLLLHNSNFRQKQHESMAPSYHVHLYIATGYTSSDGCFRQDNTPCQKLRSTQTGFLNMAMISLYSHQISVQKSACRKFPLRTCKTKISEGSLCYCLVSMKQNPRGIFLESFWIYTMKMNI